MQSFTTKQGWIVTIDDGMISSRGTDGALLSMFPVTIVRRFSVDPGLTDSSAQIGVASANGGFDPNGSNWLMYEFDGPETADHFIHEVEEECKKYLPKRNDKSGDSE